MNVQSKIDISMLAAFIANLNQKQTHHVGFCGENEEEIRDTLASDFSDYELENSFTVLSEDNRMIAALGFDIDAEKKEAEIWGPFIDNDRDDWDIIAHKIWKAAVSKLEGHFKLYGFYNKKNSNAKKFMASLKAEGKGSNIILKAYKDEFEYQIDHSIKEFHDEQFDYFTSLHDSSFPNTYYDGKTIIKRLNKYNKLFISSEVGKLTGYVYVESNPQFEEGNIEFISVSSSNRKKGTGTALLNRALNFLFEEQHIKEISICVSTENVSAIRLYHKVGFEEKHVLDTYIIKTI
jgi:ribosomal protein S18 acetylase RimI-like enzyme